MTGRNPTPGEVAYGQAMTEAAGQHLHDLDAKATAAYEAARASGWDYIRQADAEEADHHANMAAQQVNDAATWVWYAQNDRAGLRGGLDRNEYDREMEAGS